MLEIEFETPTQSQCSCCSETTVRLTRFVYRDGDAFAVYYAQFTPGHEDKHLSGLVSLGNWGDDAEPEDRVAFPFQIWTDSDSFQVGLVNADESPWRHVTLMGRILDRAEALQHELLQDVFKVTDQMLDDDKEVARYFYVHGDRHDANTELVKCSCCGKSMPLDELELSFRRPDCIAPLSQEELDTRCFHSDDACVLDKARFFVRCIIQLPIKLTDQVYGIGAWAEVNETAFNTIWALWDDEEQVSHSPLAGTLANVIPLNGPSLGCAIDVLLTGPTTRPHIVIRDPDCDLFAEQLDGISAHRARAYSSLVRPKQQDIDVSTKDASK